MRILMVNSTLHIGGAEKVTATLCENLDRSRFALTACYLKENGTVGAKMLDAGVDLVPIPGLKPAGKTDYFTGIKLARLIVQRRIQLIHAHDTHGFIDGALCRLAMPWLRYVFTNHWGNYPDVEPGIERMERLLWRVPDAIVAVGHEQSAAMRKLYGIPEDRVRVVWNGTERPEADLPPEFAKLRSDGVPVIGSISTLIPQKGIADLLQAAAMLKQSGRPFMLMIAGEGGLRSELESLASSLGIGDHVRFLGWVQEASRRALPACDIFVQPSHWEAMSVAVLEAMAAGKPVVATRVGENGRVLVDGESGLVVPPRQPQALAAALARLLDDPALRTRLALNAERRFRENFTVRHMIERHEALYSDLIGRADAERAMPA